jgi:hypothetical protein
MCLAAIRILLKDHRFKAVEDMKAVMVQWFLKQPRESIAKRMAWLVCQWDDCLYTHGDNLMPFNK